MMISMHYKTRKMNSLRNSLGSHAGHAAMKSLLLSIVCLLVSSQLLAQDMFAPSVTIDANSQNAVEAYHSVKRRADSSFNSRQYHQAVQIYLTLARYGDKFAQYRLAFMYQNGLGVNADLQQALAWAYVAAEKHTHPALGLYRSIKDALSSAQWAAAEPLTMQYLQDYGISASSRLAYNTIRRQQRDCTGSRLGSRCDRVYASSMNCNSANQAMPGKSCLVMGIAGLPGVQRMQPLTIQTTQNNLRVLIENYNPGRVEFGEFQVLEESDDDQPSRPQLVYPPRTFTIDGFVDPKDAVDSQQDDDQSSGDRQDDDRESNEVLE